jgi:hypothetical protein
MCQRITPRFFPLNSTHPFLDLLGSGAGVCVFFREACVAFRERCPPAATAVPVVSVSTDGGGVCTRVFERDFVYVVPTLSIDDTLTSCSGISSFDSFGA